jgi:hypothetical protein
MGLFSRQVYSTFLAMIMVMLPANISYIEELHSAYWNDFFIIESDS